MSEGAATPPAAPPSRQLLAGALTAGLLAALVVVPRLDQPLDGSLASAAANYHVLFFRNWDEAGFAALSGIPCVGIGGATVAERDPYLHHPVLTYWIGYAARRALGWREGAFRLLPGIATILSAVLTVLLAGRLVGPFHAFLAGIIFLSMPLVVAFGTMPNPEASVVLALLTGFLLHARLRERPGKGRSFALYAAFFVGCQLDWQVYFLAPALVVREWCRPREERRLRAPLVLFPLGVAAFTLTCAHFAFGFGDAAALQEHVAKTLGATVGGAAGHTLEAFLANQAKTWLQYLGWPVLLAVASLIGAGILSRRARAAHAAGPLLALSVPVVLNLGLFRTPSFDHDFYWMPAMVVLPAAIAVALGRLSARWPLAWLAAALLVVGGNVFLALKNEVAARAITPWSELAVMVDRLAEPEDLVLTPEPWGPTMFYAKARFYERVQDLQTIQQALERRRYFKKLHVFMWAAHRDRYAGMSGWLDQNARANDHPLAGIRGWTLDPH